METEKVNPSWMVESAKVDGRHERGNKNLHSEVKDQQKKIQEGEENEEIFNSLLKMVSSTTKEILLVRTKFILNSWCLLLLCEIISKIIIVSFVDSVTLILFLLWFYRQLSSVVNSLTCVSLFLASSMYMFLSLISKQFYFIFRALVIL